jgi:hypothetical protein
MPNIIQELQMQLVRVQLLVPRLDPVASSEAEKLLRYGRQAMALNQYEDMREALDELKAFGIQKKAEPAP